MVSCCCKNLLLLTSKYNEKTAFQALDSKPLAAAGICSYSSASTIRKQLSKHMTHGVLLLQEFVLTYQQMQ